MKIDWGLVMGIALGVVIAELLNRFLVTPITAAVAAPKATAASEEKW